MTTEATKPVVFEETFQIPASIQRVWSMFADREALCAWFCERADLDLRLGGWYRFWGCFTPHVLNADDAKQKITDYEPGRRLSFEWHWLDADTRVTLEMDPGDGETTKLRVRHESDTHLFEHDQWETEFVFLDFWHLAVGNLKGQLRDGAPVLRPDHSKTGDAVVSIEINAPAERVWRTLIEPEQIEKWMGIGGGTATVEPRVGGAYNFGWEREGVRFGPARIVELEEHVRLVTDWSYPTSDSTATEWTLAKLGPDRCRLTVRQVGVTRPTERSDYTNGWAKFLIDLRVAAMDGSLGD